MKISKNHFKLFKKECDKWIAFFGLKNWEVHCALAKEYDDAKGSIDADAIYGIARIDLYEDWGDAYDKITDYDIKLTAFHEVCELLLWNIRELARATYSDNIVNKEIHSIIRVLEYTVFQQQKKK